MLELDDVALRRLVAEGLGAAPTTIEEMPGGASTRRYLRASANGKRAVVMFVPDARPEEVTAAATADRPWPFLEVHELLSSRGIRVPHVLAKDCDKGLLVLEDLGDDTLAAFLQSRPTRREEAYRVAVTDLAKGQRALSQLPTDSVIRTRAFDETLLRWELDHFREWGLDAQDRALEPAARAEMDAIFDRLAKRIADLPRGFVHRDYQSRNLMVDPKRADLGLVWIDFQDALMGPRAYDLVALLFDSYQSIDRPFIEARLDDYAAEAGLDRAGREAIGRELDIISVQRKLKDAGRFVFIDRVKKNPGFLPYIQPSLAKVRASLERLSDDADMRALIPIVDRAASAT